MDFKCDVDVVAKFLDLTTRRVYQLVKAEVIERLPDGKFDLKDVSEKYYEFKFGSESRDLNQVKAEHEEVKKRISELKLAKMEGKLHEADDVELIMTNMLVTFRNRILSIPSKLAPQLIGMKNIGKISDLIDRELRDALNELSEYDPALFAGEDIIEGDDGAEEDDRSVPEDTESGCPTTEPNN